MLKSLSLTSHAKARERNAGFREETADICSLSLLRNPAPREGEPFCLRFATRNIFSPISREFPPPPPPPPPPHTHTLLDLLVDSTVSISFFALCFQIGDLGKRSFLIEDLHRKERILCEHCRSILYEHCRSILCEHWHAIQSNLVIAASSAFVKFVKIIAASCCIGEICLGKLSYFGTTDWHG
ncbi:hypothetical protein GQ55_9G603300 [Panicum hallii var. hallii]|uniref:Uncharacterized protein n=1 Tax=Panicum hallii var. hallii TaxID=1504633 RepID=A0A2T7CHA8_9POAL|nr:hypothetical protein GQ55_9G603300 [Panicum hallii var. hallii]